MWTKRLTRKQPSPGNLTAGLSGDDRYHRWVRIPGCRGAALGLTDVI
jgi:hypothetical protein